MNSKVLTVSKSINSTHIICANDYGPTLQEVNEAIIMPKMNQTSFFHHVYKNFDNNNFVGIFPEGGSHDRSEYNIINLVYFH